VDEFERLTREIQSGIDGFKTRLDRVESFLDKKEIEGRRLMIRNSAEAKYVPSSMEEKSFSGYLREGERAVEKKALRVADASLGGYWAPAEFSRQIIQGVTEFSPIRSIARVMTTTGSTLELPKAANTFDCAWVAEIGNRTETTGYSLGLETITPHEAYALIRAAKSFLEDAGIDIDNWLMGEFSLRFAKLEGTAFVTGNNTGQPEGILTNANVGSSNSGDGNTITADAILDIVYSLPSEYRRAGTFIMNKATALAVRKIKNNQNDYLWQPSYAGGQPDTLAGYKVVECPDMPDVANAAYPIVFGDFKRAYTIVDRVDISVQRLVEKYVEYGQIGFYARRRVGGQVTDANAIKKMLIAA